MAKIDEKGFRIEFTEWLMFHTANYPNDDIVSKFRRLVNQDVNWPLGKDFEKMLEYVKTAYAEIDGALFAFSTAHNDFSEWENN